MSQSIAFQYHRNPDAVCVTQRISWDWIMGILFSFIFVCSEMINLTSLSATSFVSRSAFIEYKTWIRACVWACFWLLNSLPNANYSLLSFAELLWRAEQVRYSVRPLWTEMGICLTCICNASSSSEMNRKGVSLSAFCFSSLTKGRKQVSLGRSCPLFSIEKCCVLLRGRILRNILPLFLKGKLWHLHSVGTSRAWLLKGLVLVKWRAVRWHCSHAPSQVWWWWGLSAPLLQLWPRTDG